MRNKDYSEMMRRRIEKEKQRTAVECHRNQSQRVQGLKVIRLKWAERRERSSFIWNGFLHVILLFLCLSCSFLVSVASLPSSTSVLSLSQSFLSFRTDDGQIYSHLNRTLGEEKRVFHSRSFPQKT